MQKILDSENDRVFTEMIAVMKAHSDIPCESPPQDSCISLDARPSHPSSQQSLHWSYGSFLACAQKRTEFFFSLLLKQFHSFKGIFNTTVK